MRIKASTVGDIHWEFMGKVSAMVERKSGKVLAYLGQNKYTVALVLSGWTVLMCIQKISAEARNTFHSLERLFDNSVGAAAQRSPEVKVI